MKEEIMFLQTRYVADLTKDVVFTSFVNWWDTYCNLERIPIWALRTIVANIIINVLLLRTVMVAVFGAFTCQTHKFPHSLPHLN